jgi:SOS response regulatory protein OraA/RecX
MSEQYRRKYGDEPAGDYAEKAKRARYLQNRGFPADWVFRVDSFDDIQD